MQSGRPINRNLLKDSMAIQNLKDKIVVITGAGSGIGRSTALAFARRGAHIVATDINEAALAGVRQDVEALGAKCMTSVLDVTDERAVRTLAGEVHGTLGAAHVLVNNAGIGYIGKFLEGDLDHWRRVMAINVMGVVHGCHAFIPQMQVAGGARHVLNVASGAANFPCPSMAAYAASKGAVLNFSEVLKMELADTGVHVSTVCPGVINTPIVKGNAQLAASVSDATMAKLQNYYATNGCSPDVVGEDMVRAVMRDGDIVLSGPGAAMIYYMRCLSLRLTRKLMVRFSHQSGYL